MHLFRVIAMTLPMIAAMAVSAGAAEPVNHCYELRVYYAAEGKLDALNSRFRDHTCRLFEKHGLTNIGYWTPVENPERKLMYIIAAPTREARDKGLNDLIADPEFKAAVAESERDGKLVDKMESTFLHLNDYSPAIELKQESPERVFELRTYITTPGNLDRLNARFRDHTVELFAKHGMTNIGYWSLDDDQPAAEKTLVYLLAHESQKAHDASFDAFRADPVWVAAKKASEDAAGGSLTEAENGVQSIMLQPTDYSPLK